MSTAAGTRTHPASASGVPTLQTTGPLTSPCCSDPFCTATVRRRRGRCVKKKLEPNAPCPSQAAFRYHRRVPFPSAAPATRIDKASKGSRACKKLRLQEVETRKREPAPGAR